MMMMMTAVVNWTWRLEMSQEVTKNIHNIDMLLGLNYFHDLLQITIEI